MEIHIGAVVMSIATFLVGLTIGYYKSLTDMSKMYCLKADCLEIRANCIKHKDVQDKRLDTAHDILTSIQIDIAEIKTILKEK